MSLVFQGHGKVGRVGDHHIGLGDIGHHVAGEYFAHPGPQPALDQRVAIVAFAFFLDFLDRHLEAVAELAALKPIVDQRYAQHEDGCLDHDIVGQLSHQAKARDLAGFFYLRLAKWWAV